MAHPVIQRRMHRIVRRSGLRPRRALEVGGYVNDKSLLRSKRIGRAERWCINMVDQPRDTGIQHVVGSANDMPMFKNGFFDLVMSCAVHEHDAKFWLSLAEMKRVLAPGGLMVVCVPGFVRRPGERGESTTTYRVHFSVDYYRFSRRAMREIFFEGMEDVRVTTVLDPPRIIGWGVKPVRRRDRVAAMLRRSTRASRRRLGRARRRLLPAARRSTWAEPRGRPSGLPRSVRSRGVPAPRAGDTLSGYDSRRRCPPGVRRRPLRAPELGALQLMWVRPARPSRRWMPAT